MRLDEFNSNNLTMIHSISEEKKLKKDCKGNGAIVDLHIGECYTKCLFCERCQKWYENINETSECLKSHGYVRCFACFKTVKDCKVAVTHHNLKFHHEPSRPSMIKCPFCLEPQSQFRNGFTKHVIEVHFDGISKTVNHLRKEFKGTDLSYGQNNFICEKKLQNRLKSQNFKDEFIKSDETNKNESIEVKCDSKFIFIGNCNKRKVKEDNNSDGEQPAKRQPSLKAVIRLQEWKERNTKEKLFKTVKVSRKFYKEYLRLKEKIEKVENVEILDAEMPILKAEICTLPNFKYGYETEHRLPPKLECYAPDLFEIDETDETQNDSSEHFDSFESDETLEKGVGERRQNECAVLTEVKSGMLSHQLPNSFSKDLFEIENKKQTGKEPSDFSTLAEIQNFQTPRMTSMLPSKS